MTKTHDTIREMTFANHISILETAILSIPLRDLVEVQADSIRRVRPTLGARRYTMI